MTQLDINLPNNSYPIFIGNKILSETNLNFFENTNCKKVAIVSDETVWKLHGHKIENLLNMNEITYKPVIISPGEKSKSFEMLNHLCKEFYKFGLLRNDFVVAFGGGVIGDLAGFAASTYMRGVPFIQIPTTLLAQVDSSVGGKVAINLDEGKNLVGNFYQPRFVISDTSLLATLPEREFKSGMSEVIKYAMIGSHELLSVLESETEISHNMDKIIYLCCKSKANFVEKDEKDTSIRMMLNFGHTFGHAIEKKYAYEKYNHGEAIAIGMVMAMQTGIKLGKTETHTLERLKAIMDSMRIEYGYGGKITDLIPNMTGDKKNCDDEITLILLRKMMEPYIHKLNPISLKHLFEEETEQ